MLFKYSLKIIICKHIIFKYSFVIFENQTSFEKEIWVEKFAQLYIFMFGLEEKFKV